MNVITILLDSLNRHVLSAYGPSEIATPNLDTFARRACRFDNHFVSSLPCMPARRDIFTGTKEFMWRPWGPLEPFDERLPRLMANNGYATGLVTDHYHYWEEAGNGYMQSFQSVETVRGHEFDFWKTPATADEPLPDWASTVEAWRPGQGRWYYANVRDFEREEDFFPAKVMTAAGNWVNEHAGRQPFFLMVDSFDPHEPFHVPEPYASMYWEGDRPARMNVWPPYQDRKKQAEFLADATQEELDWIRAQYAGKVTMVDRWFGELTARLDELNLWDDTMVIVTTDHGHNFGEHDVFAKQYPNWDTHATIPLFIWHPAHQGNGQAVTSLTSTVDLFATVLDAGGAPIPERTHSRSLLPLLEDGAATVHDAVTYGIFGTGVCCTDGEWTLFKSPERNGPLYAYSSLLYQSLGSPPGNVPPIPQPESSGHFIPGVDLPQWRVPRTPRSTAQDNYLFHRREDPGQTHNLWDAEPEQRTRMLGLLTQVLAEEGCPPEQYVRLGLTPTPESKAVTGQRTE